MKRVQRYDRIALSFSSADPLDDDDIYRPFVVRIERLKDEKNVDGDPSIFFENFYAVGVDEWSNIRKAVDEAVALFGPLKGRRGGRAVAKLLLQRELDTIEYLLCEMLDADAFKPEDAARAQRILEILAE